MKKVKTGIEGGFLFQYTDYEFLQAGALDASRAFCQAIGCQTGDVVLLNSSLSIDSSGSPTVLSLSEGYAFVEDRIVRVPSQTVLSTGSGAFYFQVVENVLGDSKIFQDGASHDVYIEETLQAFYGDMPAEEYYAVGDISRYKEIGWSNVTPEASFTQEGPGYSLQMRKSLNIYQFKGKLLANTGGDLVVFQNLDIYTTTKRGWIYVEASDGTKKQLAYELTNSKFTIYNIVAYDVIYFDGLMLGDF